MFTAVPWALCTLFFSGLHITYRQDKARAALARASRLELEAGLEGEATVELSALAAPAAVGAARNDSNEVPERVQLTARVDSAAEEPD